MAMKKSDMESCHARYGALLAEAQAAAREVRCGEAMELAVSSFEYIDGMLQYARRQKTPVFNIQAIDMVLEYAPLLFSFSSLDALESLLKSCRRIAKQAPLDYSGKLATARDAMWEAHRLWDYLEQHPDAPEDEVLSALGGDEGRWRWAIAAWERLGLLRRAGEGGASRLEVGTRMGKLVPGKCPSCGVVTEGPKAMFLEEMACPACGVTVLFVILAREGATADEKE